MKVSIVVPVFNGSRYILRCVTSILSQIGHEDELILVDDASLDDTFVLLMRNYRNDPRVILIRHPVNRGPAASRNTGIRISRGKYITFCDADDEWIAGKLQSQLDFLESHPEIDLVFCTDESVKDDTSERSLKLEEYAKTDKFHFRNTMVRREVFDRIGLMDESLRIREDTEWLVRAKKAGCRAGFIEKEFSIRHIRSDGLSASAGEEGRKERIAGAFLKGIRNKDPNQLEPQYDISILIPVYNAGKYIREAVESCIFKNYSAELILVNDGSSDDSLDVINSFRIKKEFPVTILTRTHKGQACSRNDAFRLAAGRYILYLDADDYFLPGSVEDMLSAAASEPDAMIVSALCRDFLSPELTAEDAAGLQMNPKPYRRMLAGCMLIKREVFDLIGLYNETMPTSETAEWVMRIRDAGLKILEIDTVSLARRYHNFNLGRTNRQAQMNSYMSLIRSRIKTRKL